MEDYDVQGCGYDLLCSSVLKEVFESVWRDFCCDCMLSLGSDVYE